MASINEGGKQEQGTLVHDHDIPVPSALKVNVVVEVAIPDDLTLTSYTVNSTPMSSASLSPSFSLLKAETDSVASSISDAVATGLTAKCSVWDGNKLYSDYIQDGLRYMGRDASSVIMLFESPSTASKETSFYNSQVFPIHDYPPMNPSYKTVLGPLRYSMMNGSTYPSYLRDAPPQLLLDHWKKTLPKLPLPTFTNDIESQDATVYAYLPLEKVSNLVNDPYTHYHLAGKDALHLMTKRTPKFLANTQDTRPCIAKVTHSMASKGIFVINNDDDEEELFEFLESTGRPNYVVTEFVDIARSISCHFFIHPSGDIVWLGSSENHKDETGNWSMDSIILRDNQDELRTIQYPYVREVADYCLSLGFWGLGGIDVLIDHDGNGHNVDFNPRATGTCPALMTRTLLKQDGHDYPAGIFRRSSDFAYPGSAEELVREVEAHNDKGQGKIVLASFYEESPTNTLLNIAVYGENLDECRSVINRFAQR
jgi:hypothetical protein